MLTEQKAERLLWSFLLYQEQSCVCESIWINRFSDKIWDCGGKGWIDGIITEGGKMYPIAAEN